MLLLACSKSSEKESSPTNVPEGMVYIPEGSFIMGSDKKDLDSEALRFGSKPWYQNERPKRNVSLGAFYIDKYEVTNEQYKKFIDETGHTPPSYWEGLTILKVNLTILCIQWTGIALILIA